MMLFNVTKFLFAFWWFWLYFQITFSSVVAVDEYCTLGTQLGLELTIVVHDEVENQSFPVSASFIDIHVNVFILILSLFSFLKQL